ncbi:C39 family peptidase [Microcoleus sp. ARI1-B5]|uniref:C39 family peptidase n=1 Tax=unclassified Microcoleus TaxID=2642155 RepID=UPI002FD0CD3A
MKIQDFVSQNLRYDTNDIAKDKELTLELQKLFIDLGLLNDPPEDTFGLLSTAALKRFQQQTGCDEPEFLGPQTAEKLIEAAKEGRRGEGDASILLEVIENTIIKNKPLQSQVLSDKQKHNLPAGTKLNLVFFEVERQHLKITLSEAFHNSVVWYVFGEHVEVFEGKNQVYPQQNPDEIKLNVPYKSQNDNIDNPTGACNVTSLAMCLEFFKVPRRTSEGQFEDELYRYALDQGLDRHAPNDLAQIVRDYGAKDTFTQAATIDEVKDWLGNGKPTIIHGYFTPFGHIIVVVGYDSTGFIVHDPYGEWFADGYDFNDPEGNNEKGKFQHYSYNLIREACIPDGDFWVHFISQ